MKSELKPAIRSVKLNEVGKMHFPKEDVLFSQEDRSIREIQLGRFNAKQPVEDSVSVLFEDITGQNRIEAKNSQLKGQVLMIDEQIAIPINRIIDITILRK